MGERIIRVNGGTKFIRGAIVYTLDMIKKDILAGYEVKIINEHGIDVTKEVLIKLAFGNMMNANRRQLMHDFLEMVLEEDMLLEIIERGGAEQYMEKTKRGF